MRLAGASTEHVFNFFREEEEMLREIDAPVSITMFMGAPPTIIVTTKDPPIMVVGTLVNPIAFVS
tara:strand:- start:391 stop:585 length:195 start_codon:yes stop_codon:yes gene_type:complete